MRRLGQVIEIRATAGEPVTVGDVTVTPRARAVIVRAPFGGLVWNQPTSVLVSRDGAIERRPVVDFSALLWIGALGASFLSAVVLTTALRGRKESSS